MLRLWIVVYVAGKVAGSFGPYPLEKPDECEKMRNEMINQCKSQPNAVLKCPDYELKCLPLPERPAINPDFLQ